MATEIRARMKKSAEGRPTIDIYDTKDNAARLMRATSEQGAKA
jgi:GST-like protein